MSDWIRALGAALLGPGLVLLLLLPRMIVDLNEQTPVLSSDATGEGAGSMADMRLTKPVIQSGEEPELLSSKEGLGSVLRCPAGCVHISLGRFSLRLEEKEYHRLLEMLTEAQQKLSGCCHSQSIH